LRFSEEIGGRAECLDAQADGLQQADQRLTQRGVVVNDEDDSFGCGMPLHDPSRHRLRPASEKCPREAASRDTALPPIPLAFLQEKTRLTSGMTAPAWQLGSRRRALVARVSPESRPDPWTQRAAGPA